MSDTHGLHAKIVVPDADVVVHAGDFSNYGTRTDAESFLNWFSRLPHTHKVFVAGNHCWYPERDPLGFQEMIPLGIHYLQDSGVMIEGVRFYGYPWTPEFNGWAFNLPHDGWEIRAKAAEIPSDTHVLVTHGPPRGILDGKDLGCKALARRLFGLGDLKLHVFGHIHEGYGQHVAGAVTFVNASTCTLAYDPVNPVQVVEI